MIAIVQPFIPHYREAFFIGLSEKFNIDIYCFDNNKLNKDNFKKSTVEHKILYRVRLGPFILHTINQLLNKKYDTIILMQDFKIVSTWLLLLLKPIHKKRIVLWGHGISTKRYLKESRNPNYINKLFFRRADILWFYTEKEKQIWEENTKNKSLKIALNNTISDVDYILKTDTNINKTEIKKKLGIAQEIIFIFSARFTKHRRSDLLVNAIESLDNKKFGFIIIGHGSFKPDFSKFSNVYDFGKLYDIDKKNSLFWCADAYFQPAWVGLSVVEAMAYSLPVVTFERTTKVLQCVEYHYLKDGYNSFIFKNIDEFNRKFKSINIEELINAGKNAHQYVKDNLKMSNMINHASTSLNRLI
ncbi:MAG: glycosyltransferase [Bacteroidales bacterium]|nr:glycosyltransferase [Bacteroidales bacterium]